MPSGAAPKQSFWQKHGMTEPDPEPESGKVPKRKASLMGNAALFGAGALAGGAGPILKNSFPDGFGMDKAMGPLAGRAAQAGENLRQPANKDTQRQSAKLHDEKNAKKTKDDDTFGSLYG